MKSYMINSYTKDEIDANIKKNSKNKKQNSNKPKKKN